MTVDGRWVALFNVDGRYHAIDAICLHRGGPLADGVLSHCIVTCPWHGWQFDVTTGVLVQDPRVGVTLHETRVSVTRSRSGSGPDLNPELSLNPDILARWFPPGPRVPTTR